MFNNRPQFTSIALRVTRYPKRFRNYLGDTLKKMFLYILVHTLFYTNQIIYNFFNDYHMTATFTGITFDNMLPEN